jgi:transcriptional regulator with GAF, ATPase, and Fis domain
LEIAQALGSAAFAEPAPTAQRVESVEVPPGTRAEAAIASLDTALRQHIESTLTATFGRVEGPFGAARLLGVNPHTLRSRMRKLGIDWTHFRAGPTQTTRDFG